MRQGLRDSHTLRSGVPHPFALHIIVPCPPLQRRGDWSYNPAWPTAAALAATRFRLDIPVRSPLLRDWYLLLRVLRWFSSPGSLLAQPGHRQRLWGCPIRRSRDQRVHAAPPRLSGRWPVLHRHATPRHPPSAHHVFPVPAVGTGDTGAACGRSHIINNYLRTVAW